MVIRSLAKGLLSENHWVIGRDFRISANDVLTNELLTRTLKPGKYNESGNEGRWGIFTGGDKPTLLCNHIPYFSQYQSRRAICVKIFK